MAQVDYAAILRQLITKYAAMKPSVGEIETEAIADDSLGHYEVVHTGWVNGHRVHGAVLHIDLRGGKVWIQHDGTHDGVAEELVEAGVPRDHIVLAFKPPSMRKYTDYAVS
jgi:hypothetical protein